MFSAVPLTCLFSHALRLSTRHVTHHHNLNLTCAERGDSTLLQLRSRFSHQPLRHYASLRSKTKKEKESVGTKLKNWSAKGLLKSAAQLEIPTLVDTSSPLNTNEDHVPPPILVESSSGSLSEREIALQEYLQLCKSIREGRSLESESSDAKKPSTRPKSSKSEIEINVSSVSAHKTAPSTDKPAKGRRPDSSSPAPAPPAPPAPPVSSLRLPSKWHRDFELVDLTHMRDRLGPVIESYDHELRSSADFDKFAPLQSVAFWQSSFEWDDQVNACALKYIQSANIAKQVMDPSYRVSTSSSHMVHFKPLQREAINMALAKQNMFVALATGGGKTMCYVLPALLERGLTVVVSPLIALIQDQMTLLDSMGIAAAGLSCQMSPEELESIYNQLLSSSDSSPPPFKLVYVTPERIGRNERFTKVLVELHRRGLLQRVVVDEAHCISEWGHDFRKDYRRLSILKESIPTLPIMAVTGTCTPTVRQDIAEQLLISDSHYALQTSFNRPNLWFQVSPKSPDTPMADMLYYILNRGLARECGIVFAMTTKDAERLAEFFSEQGIQTTFYHGGMTPQARQDSHARWARGEAKLMCTTVAFGLGIDKSNVRYVLHSTIPTSLEAYYQQAGRAGRDGDASDCVLFFQPKDRIKIEHVIKLNAHLLKQRQRMDEMKKLQRAQKEASSSGGEGKRRKRRSSTSPTSTSIPSDDEAVNVVDIVDIPNDGEDGIVRLLREDGSEILFDGFHPDYNEIVQTEDDPLDAFVRQMKTEKLDDVTSYCKEKRTCRRVFLMRFFGEPFVANQCDQSCAVCAPKLKRVTDKLTKKGQAEWASLKHQRDQKRAEEQERPLHPTIAKIQSMILEQEESMHQEARNAAKRADEVAYEARLDAKRKFDLRPAKPTKVGASSPLARKLRKGCMSTLGDPSDYDLVQEKLERETRKRKPLVAQQLHDNIHSHPVVTSASTQQRIGNSVPEQEKDEHETPKLELSNSNFDDLMQSIAKVSEAKALRRSGKLRHGQFGGRSSFSAKRNVVQVVYEDGSIRTTTSIPQAFGSGELDDEDVIENWIGQQADAGTINSRRSNITSSFVPSSSPSSSQRPTSCRSSLRTSSSKDTPDSDSGGSFRNGDETGGEVRELVRTSVDSRLLSMVKDACLEIAKEHRTLVKNVMSQQTMRSIVWAKPTSTLELAAIKGIGPRRAQRFSAFIIPIFQDKTQDSSPQS